MKALLYERQALEAYQKALRGSRAADLAFALITTGGLDLLKSGLRQLLERGGRLRFLVGIDMPSEPTAIAWLLRLQQGHQNTFDLKVFQSGDGGIFHTKLGIFSGASGRRSAIVGSSNLTAGGLAKNIEANVVLEASIEQFDDYFYELFQGGRARSVSDVWLRHYATHYSAIKKLENEQRKLRARLSRRRVELFTRDRSVPTRIRGVCYAFTGKIDEWPREKRLYPLVRKLGGTIAAYAGSMGSAKALVHGDILGGAKTTGKLRAAKTLNIPVISQDEFFQAVSNEERLRLRAS